MNLVIFDCENCSTASMEKQVKNIINSDIIFVIGAMQSERKFNQMAPKAKIIKSKELKRNTADFIIVATTAKMMTNNKYNQAIIVSNDTGFDAAIRYFNSEAINVIRHKPDKLLMSRGLKELCGIIAKEFNSGVKLTTITTRCKSKFWGNTNKLLSELNSLGIIKIKTVKTRQVYFSKKKLAEIAKS